MCLLNMRCLQAKHQDKCIICVPLNILSTLPLPNSQNGMGTMVSFLTKNKGTIYITIWQLLYQITSVNLFLNIDKVRYLLIYEMDFPVLYHVCELNFRSITWEGGSCQGMDRHSPTQEKKMTVCCQVASQHHLIFNFST